MFILVSKIAFFTKLHTYYFSENVSASMIPDARISLCGLPSGSTAVDQGKPNLCALFDDFLL